MTAEEELLCACAGLEVDKPLIERLLAQNLNWNLILEYADAQQITPLLFYHLKAYPIPPEVLDIFKVKSKTVQSLNLVRYTLLLRILKAFNEAEIEVILLKGIALAQFVYQNISLRPMNDLDFLIHPQDRFKVAALMKSRGFLVYNEAGEIIAVKPEALLEFHYEFDPWITFSFDEQSFWHNARKINFNEVFAYLLDPEDFLLSLILHRAYHHGMANISLRDIADIEALCAAFPPDWEKFIERVKSRKICSLVYHYIYYLKRFFKISVPGEVLNALQPFLEPRLNKILINHLPQTWSFTQEDDWLADDWLASIRILQWKMASGLKYKLKFIRLAFFPPLDHLALKYKLRPGSWLALCKYGERAFSLGLKVFLRKRRLNKKTVKPLG
jgi:hypothetical protein